MTFSSLGLSDALMRAIADLGYETPTPIQREAIPVIRAGHDILARAQTGTGKTAAFTLPLLHHLGEQGSRQRTPRVLVLAPTRELALQVNDNVTEYGRHLPFRATSIFGGVKYGPQVDRLRRGVDIVVATPGRLLDHLNQQTVDLSRITHLVLDEADRMLDMGFINDIRRIIGMLPKDRQTLLFSATLSREIRRLAAGMQRDAVTVDIEPEATSARTVEQAVYAVPREHKRALLSSLIGTGQWRQVLVFTRTKHRANRVATQLEADGITSAAIHGNKSQNARTRALADFKHGRVRALVATDIAARGLDIEQLPHVVNFELPASAEDYVHRIGRTGRAGQHGEAISLVSPDERADLRAIERLLGEKIQQRRHDGPLASSAADEGDERRPRRDHRESEPRAARPHKPRNDARGGKGVRDGERGYGRGGARNDARGTGQESGRGRRRDFADDSRGNARGEFRDDNRGNGRGGSRDDNRGSARGGFRDDNRGNARGGFRDDNRGNAHGRFRDDNRGNERGGSRDDNRGNSRRDYRDDNRGSSRGDFRDDNRGNRRGDFRDGSPAGNRGDRPRRAEPGAEPGSRPRHARGGRGDAARDNAAPRPARPRHGKPSAHARPGKGRRGDTGPGRGRRSAS